ncbi:hypothetical protein [Saccharomonospora cyanea]|uniref:Uncharacterized protein n=1 Tax=Saccharomonospora cyanea NA-134 TaxID=882082 RepID=H5XQS7_9PSEU|nr:hypothetical protein [Saccharomonospora cyanea]EHR60137.1 hypothetical protein SaccyDRAFT_1227 [Saccharomonospora cyanea NA-134]
MSQELVLSAVAVVAVLVLLAVRVLLRRSGGAGPRELGRRLRERRRRR